MLTVCQDRYVVNDIFQYGVFTKRVRCVSDNAYFFSAEKESVANSAITYAFALECL